jgi:hypothetical protein
MIHRIENATAWPLIVHTQDSEVIVKPGCVLELGEAVPVGWLVLGERGGITLSPTTGCTPRPSSR